MDTIDHQAAALARVAQYLRDKPNFEALLAALTTLAQDLETVFLDLYNLRSIDEAAGAYLDQLGSIVGQARGGLTEESYRTFIRARILVNRSSGTAPEILRVFELIFADSVVPMTLRLRDEYPAAFTLEFNGDGLTYTEAQTMVRLLRAMHAAGVRTLMEYGGTDAGKVFTFDGTLAQALDNGLFRGTLI